jgi:hypothetical protein
MHSASSMMYISPWLPTMCDTAAVTVQPELRLSVCCGMLLSLAELALMSHRDCKPQD